MDEIIVWDEWTELIRPHYYDTGGRGRLAREPETMLRMYLLQVWFTLSDVGCEEACIDSYAMHAFLKLGPNEQVPDATTLANFRHMMEADKTGELLFASPARLLQDGGVMYRGGTIVDATFIESTCSTKNTSGKRDPEMHQAKKGKTWHHGITGRDEVKDDEHLSSIDYRINEMRSRIKSDDNRAMENRKSSTRCRVEQVFHVIKDLFGLRKTPYRGLTKNTERLTWAVMSAGLCLLAMSNRRIDGSALFDTA
jgi:IS5 family transposase